MNIIIVKTSENRLIAREVIGDKLNNIVSAYNNCLYCLESDSENTEKVENITVVYDGNIHEFLPEKQLTEFFKTI